jgi:hypothetical protein
MSDMQQEESNKLSNNKNDLFFRGRTIHADCFCLPDILEVAVDHFVGHFDDTSPMPMPKPIPMFRGFRKS